MPESSLITRLKTAGGPLHQLLELLHTHRVMTTAQLATATDTPERTTSYRLDKLRDAKLIDCARPGRGTGSAPLHWWLRPAGARIVSGVPLASSSPSAMFVAHAAAISSVWLALAQHGPDNGITLTGWAADRAGWQTWHSPTGYGHDLRLSPDAVGRADVDGRPAAFFLEVDLASMTQTQLRLKVERYLAYSAARAWADSMPHCPPMLLATTTPGRAATFIRAAAKLLHHPRTIARTPSAGDSVIDHAERLVVAACGLVRDPARAVAEPVWMLAEPGTTEVTLAELLTERVTSAAAAADAYVRLAALDAEYEIEDRLHQVLHNRDEMRRISALARDTIARYSRSVGGAGLAQTQPALTQALLDLEQHRTAAAAAVVEQLAEAVHRQDWATQASAMLGASDAPSLYRAARTLLGGQLVTWLRDDPADVDAAAERARHDRDSRLAEYRADRAETVALQHQRLPWHRRRRTSIEQMTIDYDREHLAVCASCGLLYPPEPNRAGGWHEPPRDCTPCGSDDIVAWHPDHQPTGLAPLLDQLRAKLAEAAARPSPPRHP